MLIGVFVVATVIAGGSTTTSSSITVTTTATTAAANKGIPIQQKRTQFHPNQTSHHYSPIHGGFESHSIHHSIAVTTGKEVNYYETEDKTYEGRSSEGDGYIVR